MKEGRQLTLDELHDLSTLINRCAEYAIQQTKSAISTRRTPKGSSISEEWFNQLFECYCNSSYAQNLPKNYKDYVRQQASIQIQHTIGPCFENASLQKIMIPVLFYSLIVQHESKDQTVMRRINKLQEAKADKKQEPVWKRTDLFQDIATEYDISIKKEDAFDEAYTEQKSLIGKCNYYNNPFVSHKLKRTTALCENLYGHLLYLDYFNDTARMGSFLHDILNIPDGDNYNLNTILRMTIVNTFQNTLHGCGFITTKSQAQYKGDRKIPDFSDIFMGYVMAKAGHPYFEDEIVDPVPVFYVGTGDKLDIKGLYQDNANEKHKFIPYYTYLQKNFRFDTTDFIDTYLDKEILKSYISCEDSFQKFMSANTKMMRLLEEIEEVSAKMDDIATVIEFVSENNHGLEWLLNVHNYPMLDFEYDGLMSEYALKKYDFYDTAYLKEINQKFTPDMSIENAIKELADIMVHTGKKPDNPTNS